MNKINTLVYVEKVVAPVAPIYITFIYLYSPIVVGVYSSPHFSRFREKVGKFSNIGATGLPGATTSKNNKNGATLLVPKRSARKVKN